jgi:hypothetical protein
MYGWRGRIGLLVPSINTTMETEFWRIAPEGVSVHSARIAGGRHGTPEELRGMVYSAIQATAWQAYQAMGIDPGVTDCGSLLRKLSEPGVTETRKKGLRTA